MSKRGTILVGVAGGIAWSVALIWIGTVSLNLPVFSLLPALAFAFLPPGVVYLAMIGRQGNRRFLNDDAIDGGVFPPGSAGDIDARVLTNTTEQLVLALALWPPTAYLLTGDGPGIVVCLGLGFAVARLAFWFGYHLSPPLRAFGFAATAYPTALALLWGGVRWLV